MMKQRIRRGLCMMVLLCLGFAQGALADGYALAPQPLSEAQQLDILTRAVQSLEREGAGMDASGTAYTAEELAGLDAMMEEFKAGLREQLEAAPAEAVVLLSPSPDGGKWLGLADTIPFVYDVTTGDATVLLPDFLGSELTQTYGGAILLRLYTTPPGAMFEAQSYQWSPDGRYVALTFWQLVVKQMRGDIDLFLADTEAGTLRISRAFEGKNLVQGSASILQACFSEDSRTLYHTVYGSMPEGRVTLWAQDLDGGGNTFLAAGEGQGEAATFGDLSQLVPMPGGGLLQVMDSPLIDTPRGLYAYAPDAAGQWQRTEYPLPVTPFLPWEITFSRQSDRGLLHFRTTLAGTTAFSVADAGNGFADMDQLLVLRSFDGGQAERLPLDQVLQGDGQLSAAVLAAYSSGLMRQDGAPILPEEPALLCLTAAMSPTGEQALLLMKEDTTPQMGFLLLDMETLEAVPVAYPWDEAAQNDVMTACIRQKLGLRWTGDGRVTLYLPDGALPLAWEGQSPE